MIYHYFLTAIRALLRSRMISGINILGLALGIACFLLIITYAQNEFQYDRQAPQGHRVYRLVSDYVTHTGVRESAQSAPAWKTALLSQYPQVAELVRIHRPTQAVMASSASVQRYESEWAYADSGMVGMFGLRILQGNASALANPNQVIISETAAQTYFGDESPIGKILIIDESRPFRVAAVMEDMSRQQHFHFDFLASFSSLSTDFQQQYRNLLVHSYLLLQHPNQAANLEAQFPDFITRQVGSQAHNGFNLDLHLQPLQSIHLHSHREDELGQNAQIGTLYLFIAIACFILFLAVINFLNLATAQAAKRAREVGVRKVIGASRLTLILQFLLEAFLTNLLALIVALTMLQLATPLFSGLLAIELNWSVWNHPVVWGDAVAGFGGLVLVSGLYPALMISAFAPISMLKQQFVGSGGGLRKGLIVFQFVIAIGLMVGTVLVYQQMQFILKKDLGYEKEQSLAIAMPTQAIRSQYGLYKTIISQYPGVLDVSAASEGPALSVNEEVFRPVEAAQTTERLLHYAFVDFGFFETLGIPLIYGRDFAPTYTLDSIPEKGASIILNETAARSFGWKNPEQAIGASLTRVELSSSRFTVVGIIRDFHQESLYQPIGPMAFTYGGSNRYAYLFVRFKPQQIKQVLTQLEGAWQETFPEQAFQAHFLDQQFSELHASELRTGRLMTYFSILAVLIACLGLTGLSAYMAQQRLKEISIRKVLGASLLHLMSLLGREFARLVGMAALLAIPLSYWGMSQWLERFAYRIPIGPGVFAGVILLAMLITGITVGYQVWKVANINPAVTLKNE